MSIRFKKYMMLLFSLICLIGIYVFILFVVRQGIFSPYMKLKGEKTIKIEINENYYEQGIYIKDHFQEIHQNISIKSNLDNTKTGQYKITYIYEDKQLIRNIEVVDTKAPLIQLNMDEYFILFQNDEYIEYGVQIEDNSKQDLMKNLKIIHQIDTKILGDYVVQYQVSDDAGNVSSIERKVKVVENPTSIKLHYHYDSLDNTQHAWWFKKANDHQRKIATYDPMILDQYQAYYLGENKKIIYLTFDEGGNDKTYIKEITDILNRHDVKASFFLTRNYILQESEFMNELVEKGHEIGNHTRNHYDMTKLANSNDCERFVKEIMETHLSIYQITKSLPPLIFRFPKGEFSKRSLAMVHDLGFRTYFWSHAYNDYSEDVVKEVSYNNLVSHLHQGAIYLLHPSNRGNYEAMEEFILEVKSQGYTFGLVSQIKKD